MAFTENDADAEDDGQEHWGFQPSMARHFHDECDHEDCHAEASVDVVGNGQELEWKTMQGKPMGAKPDFTGPKERLNTNVTHPPNFPLGE